MISRDLFLGLVDAGHVVEGDVDVFLARDAVLAAAEGHEHAAGPAPQVAGEEEVEEAHEQQDRQHPVEQHEEPDLRLGVFVGDHSVLRVFRRAFLDGQERLIESFLGPGFRPIVDLEGHAAVVLGGLRFLAELAGDFGVSDLDLLDLATLFEVLLELIPSQGIAHEPLLEHHHGGENDDGHDQPTEGTAPIGRQRRFLVRTPAVVPRRLILHIVCVIFHSL